MIHSSRYCLIMPCNVDWSAQESPHVRLHNSRDDLSPAFVIIHPSPGPALNITADYKGYSSQSNTELHPDLLEKNRSGLSADDTYFSLEVFTQGLGKLSTHVCQ